MQKSFRLDSLTAERRRLMDETMYRLDRLYDEAGGFLSGEEGRHDVRASSHYALGLLLRDHPGDADRAVRIIGRIIDLQMVSDPSMDFYGTYPALDTSPEPPAEPWPGEHFDAEARYLLDLWSERITHRFENRLAAEGFARQEIHQIAACREAALRETVPVVWKTYDANWREFISIEWLTILLTAGDRLPGELQGRMTRALERAVEGSMRRRRNEIVPMNTNVELMYALMCELTGELLDRDDYRDAGLQAAGEIRDRYQEFESFAEYNSATYYAVDLVILSLWRQAAGNRAFREIGVFLERGLWKNIAETYHPGLRNLCGPYSRCYEEEMSLHSMLPAVLYTALGEEAVPFPEFNTEMPALIDLALLGTRIPEEVQQNLRTFGGPRTWVRYFRELIERGKPGENMPLCRASGWLSDRIMAGALSGSRNTSHQLRSAVIHWLTPQGEVDNISLMRREPGRAPAHLRTVFFDNTASPGRLDIQVCCAVECDVEVYFRIFGRNLHSSMISIGEYRALTGDHAETWRLPGLTVHAAAETVPEIRETGSGLEIIYLSKYEPYLSKYELDKNAAVPGISSLHAASSAASTGPAAFDKALYNNTAESDVPVPGKGVPGSRTMHFSLILEPWKTLEEQESGGEHRGGETKHGTERAEN